MPRVTGKIRRKHAVMVDDVKFLTSNTQRRVKITVPGPFTMAQQAQIDHYGGSREKAAMDYARAVNEEIRDLFAAGADVVQIDEPYMQARPEEARKFGLAALNTALEGITGRTAVHICFGYAAIIHSRPGAEGYSFLTELSNCSCKQISIETAQSKLDVSVLKGLPGKQIMLGVIDLSDMTVETPELVAERIRRALPFMPAQDIIVAPDCGMKYLPREVADGKLRAMVEGARIVREETQLVTITVNNAGDSMSNRNGLGGLLVFTAGALGAPAAAAGAARWPRPLRWKRPAWTRSSSPRASATSPIRDVPDDGERVHRAGPSRPPASRGPRISSPWFPT